MKYPFLIAFVTVLLPTYLLVMLTSFALTEFAFLRGKEKRAEMLE